MNLITEAQKVYASYGITTVQDGMVGKPLFQLLKAASDMKLLHLDVVGYLDITSVSDLIEEECDYAGKYRNHLKMGGYKIFLDGSPQGKTAWMTNPYAGEKIIADIPSIKTNSCKHIFTWLLTKSSSFWLTAMEMRRQSSTFHSLRRNWLHGKTRIFTELLWYMPSLYKKNSFTAWQKSE